MRKGIEIFSQDLFLYLTFLTRQLINVLHQMKTGSQKRVQATSSYYNAVVYKAKDLNPHITYVG